jgi:PAS domain S-box-containing protein
MSADYQNLNTTLIQTLRKKIEALKESEEKFETIFESIPDGVLLADINTMKFSFGNKAILHMLGYTADEIKKLSVNDIHPKKDLPYVRQVFEKQARKEIGIAPGLPVKRKDSSVFYVDINSFPLVLNGKKYLAGVFRDMTEIKKAEEALRDAEEKWTSLTRNTNDVIMIVDSKGIIHYINKTYPPYTPEETVGNSMYKYTLKEQHRIMRDSLERVFKTGKPVSYEISSDIPKTGIVAFSTKVVPIKKGKKVVKAILLATNITERKKTEEALKESEEKYKTILNGGNDGIVAVDAQTKKYIFVNKEMEKITGYTKDELMKITTDKLHPQKDRKWVMQKFQEVVAGKIDITSDIPVERKNKKVVICDIRATPTQIKGRTVIIGFFRDVTERKKAEEVLKESEEKYRTLLENLPQKIFLKDKNLVYISCNKNYANDLKIEPSKIVGKTDYAFYPKKLAEKYRGDDKKIMASGKIKDIKEEYIQDGQRVFVHTIKTPVKDEKGRVIGVLGIFWDITAQKKAEDKLRETKEKYEEEIDKMKRKLKARRRL